MSNKFQQVVNSVFSIPNINHEGIWTGKANDLISGSKLTILNNYGLVKPIEFLFGKAYL